MRASELPRLAGNERLARHAGFWWGLAEGVVFFIVPDVYITFATLFSLRAGAIAWAFSIAGSLLAVCVIYVLVTMLGGGYVRLLAEIPGISMPLMQSVGPQVAAGGLPMTPLLVFGGVPLKVYAALAFTFDISLGSALLWTILARIVRIAPVYAVVALVRLVLRRRIDMHPLPWFALLVLSWVAFYAFYFVRMSQG